MPGKEYSSLGKNKQGGFFQALKNISNHLVVRSLSEFLFFTFAEDTLISPSVWGIVITTSISTHPWFANWDWVDLSLKSVCQS